ncbi:HicB family protein [Caldalkalibacillus thermarum TA2.A1]|uniref:HicB family protein n=1 Tax=Caldalkalibacillus thermarum (strain TA2.A1) TaxID=986075 RepID=F5L5D5_CALTT|nr:type II toxin-antitoxin system HicB family antitoxin [Caldalkalibacillus thermarum]EGL83434.1 HicB family protein [Caldalkalibacillus thermarum TA2.A1]
MKKNVQYYLELPYNIVIRKIDDESGQYYYAHVLELDGCQSHGDTPEEAYENLMEAMEGYIEVKLENGDPIPEPAGDEKYSGRFMVRLPKTLHKRLTLEAAEEGVSLNQYVVYKLSK